MTIQDLLNYFSNTPNNVLGYFISIIILSLIGLLFVTPQNFKSPLNYLYGALVYAVTIPGIVITMLLLYSFFVLSTNLLQLNVITYFIPIVSMIISLIIINKTVPLSIIPGFGKLSGLITIIIITLIITYILQRMYFGVFFIGRIQHLAIFFLLLLIGVKIAWNKILN